MPSVSPTSGLVGEFATESVGEHVVAAERDLCDHPGDLEPFGRARHRARRRSSHRRATSGRAGSPASRSHPRRSVGQWPACTWRRRSANRHAGGTSPPTRAPAFRPSSRRSPTSSGRHRGTGRVVPVHAPCHGSSPPGTASRTACRRSGAATPGPSTPDNRRARSRTPRSTCRCRSACPNRRCRPTSPAGGGPGRQALRHGCRRSRHGTAGSRSRRRRRGGRRSRRRRRRPTARHHSRGRIDDRAKVKNWR